MALRASLEHILKEIGLRFPSSDYDKNTFYIQMIKMTFSNILFNCHRNVVGVEDLHSCHQAVKS